MFALVLCRIGGLFAALPVFGGKRLPNRIKILAVLSITIVCLPVLPVSSVAVPSDAFEIGRASCRERV